MFSLGELEGEVDHTFFDSDDDNGNREGGKKGNVKLPDKEEALPTFEKLQSEPTLIKSQLEKGDGAKKSPRPLDNNRNRDFGREGDCKLDKVSTHGSDSQKETDSKSSKHFMALLTEAREVDEVEEEKPEFKVKNSNKWTQNGRRTSSVSSEADGDIDSKSSCSELSSSGSEAYSKVSKSSSSSFRDRGGRDARSDYSGLSTVTDVSPLSSPESRLQSLDINHSEAEEGSLKEHQESVPSSGFSNARQDGNSSEEADESSLADSRLSGDKRSVQFPGARHRKNYSFSNDEVQRIDRENQRLLRQLSRFSTPSRPGSVSGHRKRATSNTAMSRLAHSAINRMREQQRIERENLAFLKRLESVKPTPGMKRTDQLSDYQRQAGYLGAFPVSQSPTKKSTSRLSSAGKSLRRSKATHHSARSTSVDMSSTPMSLSKKTTAAYTSQR